jgi:hypothetical protein
MEELFEKEFKFAKDTAFPGTHDPVLNRVFSHHRELSGTYPFAKFETLRFRGDESQCFDSHHQKFKDTTDYCWLGLFLASAVHSGVLPSFAGIATCVDLRPRIEKPVDYCHLKTFSVLNARTDISPSMTLREAGRQLRSDLRRRESEFEDIARLKYCGKVLTGPRIEGLCMDVTNMGALKIKWPIVDAWASIQIGREFAAISLALMSFSVMGEGKNDLVWRLRFADSVFGEDEAFEMAKSMNHFVRHISLDRTVQSAFEELQSVKKDGGR